MNPLGNLESFLYILSTSLFYPVIIGLILLVFWIIISLGSFIREYLERKKEPDSLINAYKNILEDEISSLKEDELKNVDIFLERLLQDEEQKLLKSLKKISFVIRVGPSLGLMGTLIPMGVALSSLAQGDMPAMAGSMVTAFTTTIVGLATGVAAYLISLFKEKWVSDDIRELEYLTEIALRKLNGRKETNSIKVENEIRISETK